ncbi:MAG: DegT/DnrJ/EryC1/StrS family aminotransferase [Candidatus Marinimicrobia bacterium]|nr:DegT/DnrJ/EryC1/StrS family aminotransferase [Candidatus Neomarinimicrobiota bacterium]MBT7270486.1 DegT/DnrJ/EryC1/StrS family aminotransferase [Candidatus Neomarinimicrobiota bacterium]MBT7900601.1 DegT/DnrJ/EryC1/StrS family aminotransferase [Candidatus Neomarinimicrobiota bacterium]
MIPIFEVTFLGNEKKYLVDCVDTTWISSQGKYISEFEKILAEYHQVNHAIVTSNCTTALHLSLKSLGVGPGDEVICPDLTFIAPANMIVLAGAKLVLVDIDPDTLTIDPKLIEGNINHNTKAIIVVHQFGHAAHMDEIMAIAEKYDLKIIEDNAESIGAKYKGKLLGTFGDITTYSFFGNKIITTGEGGAVLTDNDEVAIKSRELRDHGMSHKKKYYHVDLGYNYRMTNMQAAIGLAQIEKLDYILSLRKEQMNYYYEELANVDGITLRQYADWCEPVHWLMTLTLDDNYDRDSFLDYMKNKGIDCRQMINPVHHADHFKSQFSYGDFPNSVKISKQSVHLPSGLGLKVNQISEIVETIKSFLR